MASKVKERIGQVISKKMKKTVVVAVGTLKHHAKYGKTIRRTLKYKAHCEDNSCGIGDTVKIVETRPLSKEKRWRVDKIISKKATT